MSWLTDLLQGIPLNAVLKERVALAEQKFKDIEAEKTKLSEQVADLLQQNQSLRAELQVYHDKEKAAEKKPTLHGDYYKFEGEEGLFCSHCYDSQGKKVRTTAVLSGVRSCPMCKTMFGR